MRYQYISLIMVKKIIFQKAETKRCQECGGTEALIHYLWERIMAKLFWKQFGSLNVHSLYASAIPLGDTYAKEMQTYGLKIFVHKCS